MYNEKLHGLFFEYLFKIVKESGQKAGNYQILAANFSKFDTSAYFLLNKKYKWLTLRTADHPLWLKHAQQLQYNFGNPADLKHLPVKLPKILIQHRNRHFYFSLSPIEIATLYFLINLEGSGLVCAVSLPPEIAAQHKALPLDLTEEFVHLPLYLGRRNNLNHLLLPVNEFKFNKIIARLYGRNFLFSQFNGHGLLKLLPTNQWISSIITSRDRQRKDWRKIFANHFSDPVLLKSI